MAFPQLHAEHVLGSVDAVTWVKLQVKKLQLILRQLVTDIDLHAYDVAMEVPR